MLGRGPVRDIPGRSVVPAPKRQLGHRFAIGGAVRGAGVAYLQVQRGASFHDQLTGRSVREMIMGPSLGRQGAVAEESRGVSNGQQRL